MVLETARLRLRSWAEVHREPFAQMNADLEVSRDLGGPLCRAKSDAKFGRYRMIFEERGFGRWAVEDRSG